MALSGSIYGTTNNSHIECRIDWAAAQSVENNSSTIVAILYYWRTNTGYTTRGNYRGGITINGIEVLDTVSEYFTLDYNSNTQVFKATVTVPHNTDGTKSVVISATGYMNGTTLEATYLSGTIELDRIERKATLTAAPNFTDEANPAITYNNPAGAAVSSLQACIADSNGATIYVPYRDINKTGTGYTFSLTDAERKTLREAAKTANSITVKFYIKTIIGGITYYSSLAKTLSIVNASPILAPTIVDTDAATLALTGNNNTLVKYYSNAAITTGAAAKKEATIKSQSIVCGNKSLTANGTINDVETGTFVLSVTDSRGNTAKQTVNKSIVNYVKLTCNTSPSMPTTDGTMTLTIKGNYYDGSFGAVDNTLTIQYRMKTNEGSYGAWTAAYFTKSGNTYTASVNITGLDYQNKYTFQAQAIDKLATAISAEKAVRTTPVFDWGKDDFRFNVPVSFNGGYVAHNVLLWQGAYFMTANQTAPLASSIQQQPNGIVLVFSNYDTTNSVANDYDWHCYFVPKYLVDIKGGTGHCFNMMSQSFGDICSKYLYISDTQIVGHDNNTKSATNNGINYNNAKYVMRYVFGV